MYLCQVVKTRAVGKGPGACLGWEQVAVVYTRAALTDKVSFEQVPGESGARRSLQAERRLP